MASGNAEQQQQQQQQGAAAGGAGAAGGAAAPGPDAAPLPVFPLIGVEGTTFVSHTLVTQHPKTALATIQSVACLQQPLLTAPLLGLVDQLGLSRFEAHRGILQAAKHALLTQIAGVSDGGPGGGSSGSAGAAGGGAAVGAAGVATAPSLSQALVEDRLRLERLLAASFMYIGIPELREVPLAVMEKLEQVRLACGCVGHTCAAARVLDSHLFGQLSAAPEPSSSYQAYQTSRSPHRLCASAKTHARVHARAPPC